MTITRAKSKKAVSDICSEIFNKISTRRAFSVVEATRQNILKVFPLPSNHEKLPLVATKTTSSSLAGFSPVKVSLKRHTWVSSSIASTPTKTPKVFNNRPVNKLVFSSIASTSGASSISSSKKMVKKTKSSEKWKQLLVSAIVTLNPFVVSNEILDKISIASSGMSSKIDQDQLLTVLPNMMSFSRFLSVLEAKQFSPVGSPETISSHQRFAKWVASILVPDAIFKIKLAYIKTVFQSVHGFLGAKSVAKDNVKLFCMEFASQISLDTAFLVELTSFVYLATLKIAKFLVVSEFGSPSAAVVLHNMPLGISAIDIKTVLSVFGVVTHVVLKSASIWQYVVVYFENLVAATSALNHWSVLAKLINLSLGCTAFEISDMVFQVGSWTCFISQSSDSADLDLAVVKTSTLRKYHIWWKTPGCHLAVNYKVASLFLSKAPKIFKLYFVGSLSYAKASVLPVLFEFPSLVAAALLVAVVNFLVFSQLVSLESDLAKLSVLIESIVKPVGSMVKVFEQFINSNLVSSSALGLRVNKILVHMMVALKTKCNFEDVDISGLHLVGLVNNSATLFEIVQRMSSLGKFSSGAST
ncbi:hypothetical protein G9A89_017184 [Geosiphon pyriformis]|nr:hypothetical protein G9A89_017184 [Geosiphon pyriformis]